MRAHREILALKLAIFDPRFVHISVKYQGIELKILHSLLTSAPTYAQNFSPFECTWTESHF